MTQGCNTFSSYTAALYEQSKLQHPATVCNERQNTDHAMAGPQRRLNKGSSQSQFQEDVRVRSLSQAPQVFLEMALLQLTPVKDCWFFGSARAALVTPGKGLACSSSQQHPFLIPFLLTFFKLQTEGNMQVIFCCPDFLAF